MLASGNRLTWLGLQRLCACCLAILREFDSIVVARTVARSCTHVFEGVRVCKSMLDRLDTRCVEITDDAIPYSDNDSGIQKDWHHEPQHRLCHSPNENNR